MKKYFYSSFFMFFLCTVLLTYANDLNTEEQRILNKVNHACNELIDYEDKNPNMTNSNLVILPIKDAVSFCMKNTDKINISFLQTIFDEIEKLDIEKQVIPIFENEIIKYCTRQTLSPEGKRSIVYFLIKNCFMTDIYNINVSIFVDNFPQKEDYSTETKVIIKQRLLKQNLSNGRTLLLLAIADLLADQEVLSFLHKESVKCTQWGDGTVPWFSLLLLAQNGDGDAIQKVAELSQIVLPFPERRRQVRYMPAEISIIHDKRIVDVLIAFMDSNEGYPAPGDPNKLNAAAAMALSSMIVDFPELDYNEFENSKEMALCKKWVDDHKTYQFKGFNKYPLLICR